jgi:hypothetical protein
VAPGTWDAQGVVEALRVWTREEGPPPRAFEWCPMLGVGGCPLCGGIKVRAEARTCRACRPRHAWWPAFSDEQLLERIQAWAVRFGGPPTRTQWRPIEVGGHPAWELEHPAWPAPSLVLRRYGSWRAAPATAGVAPITWTPAAMVYALRRFGAEHGHPPTARQWSRSGPAHPSASLVATAFGSWERGLRAAGLQATKRGAWTRAEIADALRALADELGRPPRAADLRRGDRRTPGYATIRRHYGSLNDALRAARLEPPAARPTGDHRAQPPAAPRHTRERRLAAARAPAAETVVSR